MSLYDEFVPPLAHALGALSKVLEKGAAQSLIDDLKWRGEVVGNMTFTSSGVQMIAIDKGRKLPASDPRKHGSAKAE